MPAPKLIESIRVEDGEYANINYHQSRMEQSCAELGIAYTSLLLQEFLNHINCPKEGLWKCRVGYSTRIEKIEFKAYRIKEVNSLKVVHDNSIEYSHKFEERSRLTSLYKQRGDSDDIIIVKNGMVTDSYYGNLLFLKAGVWYTPNTFLLPGTMRQRLIDLGKVVERDIRLEDIAGYEKVKIVNAMLDFELGPELEIGEVQF